MYDEDFWGEDFSDEPLEEGTEDTEGTEGTEGAEGIVADVDLVYDERTTDRQVG